MFQAFKELFDSIASPASRSTGGQVHSVRLATAVLLVEVMRADPTLGMAERKAVVDSLRNRFTLAEDDLARLVELTEHTARTASDFHQFTSVVNDHFGQDMKIQIVEQMWQVAYADGHLDAHENHLIARVAELLHVTHGQYIAAKLRAKEGALPT